MMTTARSSLPLELDVISKRELDKLKQKMERLDNFLRIRILRGLPEEEVEVWSDHCLHHEESFTDKRHYIIIVAPKHRDFIKNVITDPLQMGTALIMTPVDGSFATAIAKNNHRTAEIQQQIRQHSRLINTLGMRQTLIDVNRADCDAAGCKHERYFETLNEMRSLLIKIDSNGIDHRPDKKVADESFVKGQTQVSL